MTGILCRLFRWRLALMNAVAALAGYGLFPGPAQWMSVTALFLGVFLLAAGSSALNQYLERDLDRLMLRTCKRPLPKGDMDARGAAGIGAGCTVAGLVAVAAVGGVMPAVIGGAVVTWYLGLYTPLKRRTPFSLLLGALCGAAAPMVGWTFAGGRLLEFPVLLLAVLLYLWQVPHFWLLQRRHAQDYRRAGFAVLDLSSFGLPPGSLVTLWLTAVVAVTLMFPLFGLMACGSAFCWVAVSIPLLLFLSSRQEPALFTYLNLFPLLLATALWKQ